MTDTTTTIKLCGDGLYFPSVAHAYKTTADGQPEMLPPKTGRQLESTCKLIVGTFCRAGHGGTLHRRCWILTDEEQALLNGGSWLVDWDEPTPEQKQVNTSPFEVAFKAAIRGASTKNQGGIAKVSTRQKTLEALAQVCAAFAQTGDEARKARAAQMIKDLRKYRWSLVHHEMATAPFAAPAQRPLVAFRGESYGTVGGWRKVPLRPKICGITPRRYACR